MRYFFLLLALCALLSCNDHGNHRSFVSMNMNGKKTKIAINESERFYSLSAVFDAEQTSQVQNWLDENLSPGTPRFRNANFDAKITLDNRMTFNILLKPGELQINFPIKNNSPAGYQRIKKVGDGMREVLGIPAK